MVADIQGMLDALAGRYILRNSHDLLEIQREQAHYAGPRTAAEQSHIGEAKVACAYWAIRLGHLGRQEGEGNDVVGDKLDLSGSSRLSVHRVAGRVYSTCRKAPRSVGLSGLTITSTMLSMGGELELGGQKTVDCVKC